MYNAQELHDIGFGNITVCPVLWQMENIGVPHNLNEPCVDGNNPTVLFVGRITPNKCHQDLIATLALLSRIRPQAKLVFVGDATPALYQQSLERFAARLGMTEQVHFLGKISDEELVKKYQSRIFLFALPNTKVSEFRSLKLWLTDCL